MKTATYNEIDYNDFDDLVNKHFNTPGFFEFVASEECGNGSSHSYMNVTKEEYNKEIEAGLLGSLYVLDHKQNKYFSLQEAFENRIFPMYCGYAVLLELVGKEVLPEGNYLINVFW